MATTFGQAFIFAIQFCHDFDIQMTDQQMHDFCNLLIEFRDGSRPTPRALDTCPRCEGVGSYCDYIGVRQCVLCGGTGKCQ